MKIEKGFLLWIGEQKNPVATDRRNSLIMDSAINYINSEELKLPYVAKQVFLDNGAFTSRTRGEELDRELVLSVQEALNPDLAIPLDYPYLPSDSTRKMRELWKKTQENILWWSSSSSLKNKIVPTLHAWSSSSLKENIKWLQKKADAEMISLGSLVMENFNQTNGFFGDRQPNKSLINMLSLALESIVKNSDFSVHILGLGSSPLMLSLAYYLGFKSTDSAGYRRKAAYGKIVFLGKGELYAGNGTARFGAPNTPEQEKRQKLTILREQEKCDCPVCTTNPEAIFTDWRMRAIHNEHVMNKQKKILEIMDEMGKLETYLDGMFKNSAFRHLWEYTKRRKDLIRISKFLRESRG